MIGLMTDLEIDGLLSRRHVGHLGCTANDRPYVVPINFVYDADCLYSYSAPGRKIDVMREQPLVAFQVDEIESESCWRSVMIEGVYHELSGVERERAIERLTGRHGLVTRSPAAGDRIVVYKIVIDHRSGRFESHDF